MLEASGLAVTPAGGRDLSRAEKLRCMPRAGYDKEKLAEEIVRAEETDREVAQRAAGCDFFSTPPHGGLQDAVEMKGCGVPVLAEEGAARGTADVNAEPLKRAERDPRWRLEIVANLDAAIAKSGSPQRLTLSGEQVTKRARPPTYWIDLDGLS
jgi:hypothetical protein